MAFLTATANKVLDSILRNTDYVQAVDLFLSIHTATPVTTGNEYTGYDGTNRPDITFDAAAAKVTQNITGTDLDFVNFQPGATIAYAGLVDQAAHGGGTWWWEGALAVTRVVVTGDTLRFPAVTGVTVTLT